MSKRLVRLKPKEVFSKLGNIPGLEVNAVLQNGLTYLGKTLSVTADHILLEDARRHHHKIEISDLYEIIYDRKDINTFAPATI